MLTRHTDEVFSADDVVRLPGLRLPVRMTVIRLADGGLWVHSPIAWSDSLGAEVATLGPVRFLVSPSLLHHLFIGEWAARFPAAQVWASPDLHRKRGDLTITGTHGGGDEPWHADIDTIAVGGAPKFQESVFFHGASRSLLVTDLLFNLRDVGGFAAPLLLRLMGVHRRLAQSRAWRFTVRDRAAFAATGRKIVELAPERLIVAHGEVIERLAEGQLAAALTWMIAGDKRAISASRAAA
jgi:hypothetical protein